MGGMGENGAHQLSSGTRAGVLCSQEVRPAHQQRYVEVRPVMVQYIHIVEGRNLTGDRSWGSSPVRIVPGLRQFREVVIY